MSQEPLATATETEPGAHRRPKVFYGWWIVAAGTCSSFLTQAIFTIGPSAYIPEVRDSLGWSVTAISIGLSIKQFESGLLGPLFGYLIDRVGPRPMGTTGVIIMTVGLLMWAQMSSLWTFYGAVVIMAVGQSMGATQAYTAAMVHWFRRKRGRAASFLGTGTAMGYVGVYPITLLIALAGWRNAATISALLFCAIALPLVQTVRHRPQPYGYLPDGDPPAPEETLTAGARAHEGHSQETDESVTVGQALRTRAFWMVLLARAFYGLTTNVHHVHQVPHLVNRGFSTKGAGLFVSVYGASQVLARLASGTLGDRVGRYELFRSSFLLLGIGWWAFAFVSPDSFWSMAFFFLTYGLGHAAHVVAGQAILADYFGPGRYATISGMMSPMSLAISIVGPVYGGIMYDAFGSYERAFLFLGPVIATVTFFMFIAGRPTLSGEVGNERIGAGEGH